MRLREYPESKRKSKAVDVAGFSEEPESKDNQLVEFEQSFEQDRQAIVKILEKIVVMEKSKPRSEELFAGGLHCVTDALIINQVLREPLDSELINQAVRALRRPDIYARLKVRTEKEEFDKGCLEETAELVALFPEARSAVGVTEELRNKWTKKIAGAKVFSDYVADRPMTLVHLTQLWPDHRQEYLQILSGPPFSLKVEPVDWMWKFAQQKDLNILWVYNPMLAAIRLLQQSRTVNQAEKQKQLMGVRDHTKVETMNANVTKPFRFYAEAAILLAPRAEIDSSGRIVLSKSHRPFETTPLPLREDY